MRYAVMAAALVAASPAHAEADRGSATKAFVDVCMRQAGRIMSEPEPTCACSAGVLSGRMSDRQYEIMGRLAPATGNQTELDGQIMQMIRFEGFSFEEIVETGELLGQLDKDIERTCRVLER